MRGLVRVPAQRGITFIELMVALVIMAAIAGVTSRILVRSWQSEEITNDQNQAQRTAQQAVDAIVDRLRAAATVTSGEPGEITVGYRNADMIIAETITFALEGGALRRTWHNLITGETITETVVPSLLTKLTFAYRQRDGTGWRDADTPPSTELVIVSVTAADGRTVSTETSFVKLRNKTS